MELIESLGLQPIVVLINVAFFLAVYIVMKGAFFGRVTAVLEERKREFDAGRADIDSRLKASEELAARYGVKFAEVEKVAYRRHQEVIKEANIQRGGIVASAHDGAEQYLKATRVEIVKEKERAIGEMRSYVPALTADIAAKLTRRPVREDEAAPFVEQALKERLT